MPSGSRTFPFPTVTFLSTTWIFRFPATIFPLQTAIRHIPTLEIAIADRELAIHDCNIALDDRHIPVADSIYCQFSTRCRGRRQEHRGRRQEICGCRQKIRSRQPQHPYPRKATTESTIAMFRYSSFFAFERPGKRLLNTSTISTALARGV